jgi:serine/threonine-protein kinase
MPALLVGRYVLHGEIASGGMATVSFGRAAGAAGFSRAVAIKRLLPHLARDPEFRAMFVDEARLAARVRHPNVVPTLDVVAQDDELFLVMEYVAGESLAALLRASPRVPASVAASIAIGALSGLHAAHEARGEDGRPLEIVHRDVSPHNILIGADGLARVLDFGIARATVRSRETRDGRLRGKISYMAPEQLRGAPATRRADVYATAVTLWEMLAGERLFDGESDAAVFGRVLEGVVRPPSAHAPVHPALDAVVMRGIDRDPEARFATALEMAEAIERAATVASAREVSAWVAEIAGPVLADRARRVQEIEAGEAGEATSAPRSAPEITARTATQETAVPAAIALPQARSLPTSTLTAPANPALQGMSRGRRIAVGAGAAIAMVAGVSFGASRVSLARAETARSGIARATLLTVLRAETRAQRAEEPADPPKNAPESSASAAPASKPPRSARMPAPSARSSCDPPTYVDATGIRRVKRECL